MDKKMLKKLAEVSFKQLGDKKTVELVKWASLVDGRAERMSLYLEKNPGVGQAQINNEMARIVFQEVAQQ